MHLKLVDEETLEDVSTKQVFLHNIGKVLFLPLDLIIGLIAQEESTPKEKSQIRLSQRLSHTVVLKKERVH